jgi:S-adenosyl-L-methionine hydrolase (adenosine-forming)
VDRALITFLSDFGYTDEFVGVCHGVIAVRCSQARVIDITHGILRHDIRAGALLLRAALAYMPAGVHLAVVDPGVGLERSRRAVALLTRKRGDLLVGPDNGLLWPAAELFGGVVEAVDIGGSHERLEPVSATFHGRDVFAPVAAALACGEPPAVVGQTVAIEELTRLTLARAHVQDRALRVRVLQIDGFGNLSLDASTEQLAQLGVLPGASLEVQPVGRVGAAARYESTFGEVAPGELLLHKDSRQMMALAVNQGEASARLQVGAGDELILRLR